MSSPPSRSPEPPLVLAFELLDFAEALLRQRLRRENPGIGDEEIEERVAEWYSERPGAELGDAPGVPGVWPRR